MTTIPSAPAQSSTGGVRAAIGAAIREIAGGYEAATDAVATQVDRASIHPFEGVTAATALLKQRTANVKGLNRVTGLAHVGAGFGMLVAANTVASGLRAPGTTVADLADRAASLIEPREAPVGGERGGNGEPAPVSRETEAMFDLGLR